MLCPPSTPGVFVWGILTSLYIDVVMKLFSQIFWKSQSNVKIVYQKKYFSTSPICASLVFWYMATVIAFIVKDPS